MRQRENTDGQLGVRFFVKAFENKRKSAEAGRPIFEDREMIEIIFPADRKRSLVAPANEMHFVDHAREQMTYAERFKPIYDAWKASDDAFVPGTPLSEAPFLTASSREEAKAEKIQTVEQLAGLPDTVLRRLGPGWRERVEQAKAFLDAASSTSEIATLRAEIEQLRAAAGKAKPQVHDDQFAGFDRDDLFNMATDAGLEPRKNASRDALVEMLTKKAEEAA